MSEPFLLAQISDLHIGAGVGPTGRDASDGLRAALAAIGKRRPHAILATGDLVNDAGANEYAELAAILKTAPAPVFLAPGNHDDIDLMRAAFPGHEYLPKSGTLCYSIDHFPLRVVVVDETVRGEVGGCFSEAHARWLDAVLKQAPDHPTLVGMHHPPLKTHDLLLDTLGMEGSDIFTDVIARHPQVIRIVFGHHHRLVFGEVAHAPAVMAPSTAWTYGLALRPEDPVAPRTQEPCGYMIHVWRAGAGLASHYFPI